MLTEMNQLSHGSAVQSCGPARVVDLADDGRIQVQLDNGEFRWGRTAVPYPLAVGDHALVLVTPETVFAIGVLGGSAPRSDFLQVERQPETGRTRVTVPADLELCAPQGSITLNAAEGVRLVGEAVDLVGRDKIRATVPNRQPATHLQLDHGGTTLKTPAVTLLAEKVRAAADDVTLQANTLAAKIDDASLECDSLTTVARTVCQSAGDWYQEIAGLMQTTAGRTEIVVAESVHLEAERAIYETEKDFKITGEQIHLG